MSPTRPRRKIRAVLLVTAAAAAVAVTVVAVPRLSSDDASPAAASTSSPPGDDTQLDGTTTGSSATSSAPYTVKPEPSRVATDEPVPSPTGGEAQVVLTYAGFQADTGTVQANGFVAGVIEEGGTCTLTLTRDGDEVTARSTATADATTTSCGLLETGDGLAAGTWDAVLSYASATVSGQSESVEVTVE